MLTATAMITAFTTLFVIIDPPGTAPIFLALTRGIDEVNRRKIAIRACLVALVMMFAFLFLGEAILNFIGISIPAFRIAGGVLLFLTALDMLFERRQTRRRGNAENAYDPSRDPAVFPLAIPLIVGPGLITTLILLASEASSTLAVFSIGLLAAINIGFVFLACIAAPTIEKVLGAVGINVLTRVLGMFLAALAVQFILDGLRSAFAAPLLGL